MDCRATCLSFCVSSLFQSCRPCNAMHCIGEDVAIVFRCCCCCCFCSSNCFKRKSKKPINPNHLDWSFLDMEARYTCYHLQSKLEWKVRLGQTFYSILIKVKNKITLIIQRDQPTHWHSNESVHLESWKSVNEVLENHSGSWNMLCQVLLCHDCLGCQERHCKSQDKRDKIWEKLSCVLVWYNLCATFYITTNNLVCSEMLANNL